MGDKSRLSPEEPFPSDLEPLEDSEVEVLNSKVHRQLDLEYVEGNEPDPETESRHEELEAELDFRDAGHHGSPADGRNAVRHAAPEPAPKLETTLQPEPS